MCRYRVPEGLHADQGRNSEADLMSELCKRLDMPRTRSSLAALSAIRTVAALSAIRTVAALSAIRTVAHKRRMKHHFIWHLDLKRGTQVTLLEARP